MSADRFTGDHLLPRSLGGSDDLENLALACHRCNQRRYNDTTGIDPQTQTIQPLFNPRQQNWVEHFCWTKDGLRIIGTTLRGRATCNRLDFNDLSHDQGAIQRSRWFWVKAGWHPPPDDPRQT